ncbi:MAG: threonine synthase [Methanopyri archaeon]|nr:threonine synthase [Methanopyri archaeon]
MRYALECVHCGRVFEDDSLVRCPECGGLLEVTLRYDEIDVDRSTFESRGLGVWTFRELLPVDEEPVTMSEGGTGLHPCDRLAEEVGVSSLQVKNEGENPTGSFKDRGMTVGVTKARELGAEVVACASTGNTSASLAAYAARAGIRCVVLLPAGKVALGKLAQALFHGAEVIPVDGNFDDALSVVKRLADEGLVYILNSVNPFRLSGQRTIAYEICLQRGWDVPDAVVVPVGNAGNISAIWQGFLDLYELGLIEDLPRMYGVQAEGAKPVVEAIRSGAEDIEPDPEPETVATAIRIGDPVNAVKALRAIRCSGGWAVAVSDEEILAAQRELATTEGIFVEPASAASIAGLRKFVDMGEIGGDEDVVCVTTGHGLKDPEIVMKTCELPEPVPPDPEVIAERIKGA